MSAGRCSDSEVRLHPHGDAFLEEKRSLAPPHRDAPIGVDDAMPGHLMLGGRKNAPGQARRTRFDVAVGADEAGRDRSHSTHDALDPLDPRLRCCFPLHAAHPYIIKDERPQRSPPCRR
jgi:hypothetical protein